MAEPSIFATCQRCGASVACSCPKKLSLPVAHRPPANCPRCGADLRDEHGNNNGICRSCIWPVEPWTRHHFNLRVWWPITLRWRHLQAFRRRLWWRIVPSRRPSVKQLAEQQRVSPSHEEAT